MSDMLRHSNIAQQWCIYSQTTAYSGKSSYLYTVQWMWHRNTGGAPEVTDAGANETNTTVHMGSTTTYPIIMYTIIFYTYCTLTFGHPETWHSLPPTQRNSSSLTWSWEADNNCDSPNSSLFYSQLFIIMPVRTLWELLADQQQSLNEYHSLYYHKWANMCTFLRGQTCA